MRYRSEKLVNDGGQKGEDKRTRAGPWTEIRARSIIEFVNKVAMLLGAPLDRDLREQLYATVFSDGLEPVRYRGITYTAPMLLDLYFRREDRMEDHVPFQTRAEWDGFCDAMRKLRDPNIPMTCKPVLLRIGETIEAWQRAHAEKMGWA